MKSIWMISVLASILIIGTLSIQSATSTTFLGPSPYLEFSDSPFSTVDFSGGYFHLEDFEDSLFNVPGVVATGTGVCITPFTATCSGGPQFGVDSVDIDDGVINGWGNGVTGPGVITNPTPHSHFASPGSVGITYTFDDTVLCALPTHVGIVWTDGLSTVTFEAFDSGGGSLGTDSTYLAINDGFVGQTPEDRFYGAIDLNGISKITISNRLGGIEADHLQYGIESCPDVAEPSEPRTIGFWKNHPDETEEHLSILIGDLSVDDFDTAKTVFKVNAKNAHDMLAAQLLAAEINVLNGVPSCDDVDDAISDAQSELAGADYTGPGSTTAPKKGDKGAVNAIKDVLDDFNNNGCS